MTKLGLEGVRVRDPRLKRLARLGAAMSYPKQRNKAADLLGQRLRGLIGAVEIAPVQNKSQLLHTFRVGVNRPAQEIVGEKAQHAAVGLSSRDTIGQFPHQRSSRIPKGGQPLGNLHPRRWIGTSSSVSIVARNLSTTVPSTRQSCMTASAVSTRASGDPQAADRSKLASASGLEGSAGGFR